VPFSRYPEYKDSGIAWLGEVPLKWPVVQTKRCFTRKKELNAGMICGDRLALTMKGVVSRDLNDLDGLQASEFETYQIFEPDDLAFKLIDLQNIKTSRVGHVHTRGIMSPAYLRLVPDTRRIAPRFGYWFFTNLYLLRVFNELGGGVRQTIGSEELLTLPILLPSEDEQIAIVTFLDRETAKIDALIAEQEKLIALLKDKRQALISHAVTKGLNPDVPMKDSGLEWLGQVPAHWEVCPLKYLSRIGNGSTPNRDNPDYWGESGFPWLNSSVVNQDEVTEAQRFVTELALKDCHLPVVKPPAVLVGITGQGKTRGMAAPLMFEATINQHVAYIQPQPERLRVSYLLRVLEIAYEHLRMESDGSGSTKGAITCDQLSRFSIPLPKLDEQNAIATHLDAEATKFDSLADASRIAICLLQKRRAALISDAVTGKICVLKGPKQ
jgi:type I restriction enzyme S subunit